jgi:hypothetical protein
VIGDFYYSTTLQQFYGPKTAGGWGTGIELFMTLEKLQDAVAALIVGGNSINVTYNDNPIPPQLPTITISWTEGGGFTNNV